MTKLKLKLLNPESAGIRFLLQIHGFLISNMLVYMWLLVYRAFVQAYQVYEDAFKTELDLL